MRFVFILFITGQNTALAQAGFGPEIGLGFSSYKFAPATFPVNYTSASVSAIFSGKVGGLVDLPLSQHYYFQGALFLSHRGADKSFSYYRNDSFHESVQQTLGVYYTDLSLNVLYKTRSQDRGRLFLGVGANPSYIIGGQNRLQDEGKYDGTSISGNGTYKVVAGQTLRGFDIGLNLQAGYELPTGLFFRFYYTTGVTDIGLKTELDKNRMYGISAGYLFGRGRNVNKDAGDLIDKGQ